MRLSATDLANHLACAHLTTLDRGAALGLLTLPHAFRPDADVLAQRGLEHERQYLDYLEAQGRTVTRLEAAGDGASALERTLAAMFAGADIIAQATLVNERWLGRADVLVRVPRPSGLGDWSYEALDTKLARETKAGAVLQLCLYTELLAAMQGEMPERMHVVPRKPGFPLDSYRVDDYLAYYRFVLRRLVAAVDDDAPARHLSRARHALRDLSLAAGVREGAARRRSSEPRCGHREAADARARIARRRHARAARHRAHSDRLEAGARVARQLHTRARAGARAAQGPRGRPLPVRAARARAGPRARETCPRLRRAICSSTSKRIPTSTTAGSSGCSAGWSPSPRSRARSRSRPARPSTTAAGRSTVAASARRSRPAIDTIMERWAADPNMHVYHYGAYEPSALKRLMGRHATRADEIDRLLRAERFVDLLGVVKQSLRASVEDYSIKRIEPLFGYERVQPLFEAGASLRLIQRSLELGAPIDTTDADAKVAETYNRDDCLATLALRDWLERVRADVVAGGAAIARPDAAAGRSERDDRRARARGPRAGRAAARRHSG
jgi:uncharacterized protein